MNATEIRQFLTDRMHAASDAAYQAEAERIAAEDGKDVDQQFNRYIHCMHCGRRPFGGPLEKHHICRGPYRKLAEQFPATWLRLCRKCHRIVEDWSISCQLAMKSLCDPGNYGLVTCNLVRGRSPDAITEEEVQRFVPEITVPPMYAGGTYNPEYSDA